MRRSRPTMPREAAASSERYEWTETALMQKRVRTPEKASAPSALIWRFKPLHRQMRPQFNPSTRSNPLAPSIPPTIHRTIERQPGLLSSPIRGSADVLPYAPGRRSRAIARRASLTARDRHNAAFPARQKKAFFIHARIPDAPPPPRPANPISRNHRHTQWQGARAQTDPRPPRRSCSHQSTKPIHSHLSSTLAEIQRHLVDPVPHRTRQPGTEPVELRRQTLDHPLGTRRELLGVRRAPVVQKLHHIGMRRFRGTNARLVLSRNLPHRQGRDNHSRRIGDLEHRIRTGHHRRPPVERPRTGPRTRPRTRPRARPRPRRTDVGYLVPEVTEPGAQPKRRRRVVTVHEMFLSSTRARVPTFAGTRPLLLNRNTSWILPARPQAASAARSGTLFLSRATYHLQPALPRTAALGALRDGEVSREVVAARAAVGLVPGRTRTSEPREVQHTPEHRDRAPTNCGNAVCKNRDQDIRIPADQHPEKPQRETAPGTDAGS